MTEIKLQETSIFFFSAFIIRNVVVHKVEKARKVQSFGLNGVIEMESHVKPPRMCSSKKGRELWRHFT